MRVKKPTFKEPVLVGIILPAYNEAAVIKKVLSSIPDKAKIGNNTVKIITVVVNDGSTDRTGEIVRQNKRVNLIQHIQNSGAGAATRTGIHYAIRKGCEYVVTMDSDGQHTVEDVLGVVAEALKDESDLVIGSRLLDTKGMPWYRVVGNKGLSLITFIIFGVFVKDSQSGLKVFNMNAAKKIEFHSNDYAFCSEIIWSAHRNKLRIKEVPIKAIYTEYSLQKGQSNWGAIAIIKQITKRRFMGFLSG